MGATAGGISIENATKPAPKAIISALADAEHEGDLTRRDTAIGDAINVLRDALARGDSSLGSLSVATSAALRRRWRSDWEPADLFTAMDIMTRAEAGLAGEPTWAASAAELAAALLDLADGMTIGAIMPPPLVGAAPQQVDAAVFENRVTAGYLARGALSAANADSAVHAQATLLIGDLYLRDGRYDTAVAWLSRVDDARLEVDAKYQLARAYAAWFDAEHEPAHRDAAYQLLDELCAPHVPAPQAFEAGRFATWWATHHEDWPMAARHAIAAMALRESLRRSQRTRAAERHWLSAVGNLPSLAAYALAMAGTPDNAVEVLDGALMAELSDRLRTRPVDRLDFAAIARTADAEPIVYLVVTDRGGMALTVAHGSTAVTKIDTLTRTSLHEALMRYADAYAALKRDGAGLPDWRNGISAILTWLGSTVTECLIGTLDPGTPSATIVTDGVLGMLPLHAATTAMRTTIDTIQLRFAPNAATLARARAGAITSSSSGELCVAVADVPKAPLLTYARAEARAILDHGAELLVDDAATVVEVSSALQRHHLAHFACHGITDFGEPDKSALILAGGAPLTLARLRDLDALDIELVVLSACESGISEVDIPTEKSSLPAGLLLAGARGVIASLWLVDDCSTMLLMIRLHQLRRNGLDGCAALRAAQRWLRDTPAAELDNWAKARADEMQADGVDANAVATVRHSVNAVGNDAPFAHPFYWAGFAYYGA
jgi:hypothetical protein